MKNNYMYNWNLIYNL